MEHNKPVVGICRGFQLLGMMLGFKGFIQDLSFDKKELHASNDKGFYGRAEPAHVVQTYGSFKKWLTQCGYGDKLTVNSWHHQGIYLPKKGVDKFNKLYGVEVIASTDKIVEGFQHISYPMIGFQYHLEEYDHSLTMDYILAFIHDNEEQGYIGKEE